MVRDERLGAVAKADNSLKEQWPMKLAEQLTLRNKAALEPRYDHQAIFQRFNHHQLFLYLMPEGGGQSCRG